MIIKNKIFKEFSSIVIGQVLTLIGSVILVKLLTNQLLPSEYGKLSLALSINGFLTQIIFSGLTPGIGRFFYSSIEKNQLSDFKDAIFKLSGKAILLVFGVLITTIFVLHFTKNLNLVLIFIFGIIFAVAVSFQAILNAIFNASRAHINVAVSTTFDSWLKVIFVLISTSFLGNSSSLILLAYALSTSIIIVYQIVTLKNKYPEFLYTNTQSNFKYWEGKIWNFSWPFAFWGIFTWFQLYSDRFFLEYFTSTYEVGFYAVIYQLGFVPASIGFGFISTLITPIFYQKYGKNDSNIEFLSTIILKYSLFFSLVAFAVISKFHSEIFSILVDEKYISVSYLLPWMVLSGCFFSTGQNYSVKLMAEHKINRMLPIKIFTALLGVLFNFLGASMRGMEGIVAANLLFSFTYLIWMVLDLRKHTN